MAQCKIFSTVPQSSNELSDIDLTENCSNSSISNEQKIIGDMKMANLDDSQNGEFGDEDGLPVVPGRTGQVNPGPE